jgi:hypothetical protein
VSWADCTGASWNGHQIHIGLGPCVLTDDGRIGVPPVPRISEGIAAMTPTEMEEAIKNLQLQWNRIEQFLPNLATRGELVAEIQDARRHAVILNEATRDQIRLLAENLARVEATMATKEDLKQLEGTLSAQIGRLASQIATPCQASEELTTKRTKNTKRNQFFVIFVAFVI